MDKFYHGYEGEKAIQFSTEGKKLVIWEGFFDDIMEQFEPDPEGWRGVPYYYHLAIGWYEECPWKVPDLKNCLQQFDEVNLSKCRFSESREVRKEICNIFRDAIKKDNSVWISEE